MFRKGQEIVSIASSAAWRNNLFLYWGIVFDGPLPEKDEIYHCAGYETPFDPDFNCLMLVEFPSHFSFDERGFRPLIKVEHFMTSDAPAPQEKVGA